MHNLIAFIIFYIFSLSLTPKADAAACCTSATAFGTGRLLAWETFALGLNTAFLNQLSDFDDETNVWVWDESEDIHRQWSLEIWGIVDIGKQISAFASIPLVMPTIIQPGIFEYGYGFGDIKSGLRYQAIRVGEYQELPAIALLGALIFPTATGPGKPKASDVTGRGIWAFALGTSIEKTWMPWYTQLNIGATVPFKSIFDPTSSSFGPSAQIGLAGGIELLQNIVLSLIGQWNYEGDLYGHKTSAILAASWRFHPHFTLQSSLSADIVLEPISYGLPGNIGFNIGIRYGYF